MKALRGTRWKMILLAIAAALVVTGTALAETPAQISADTKTTFDKKLAFVGSSYRVGSVRCLEETSTYFFCIGKMVAIGHITTTIDWNVTITGGTIHWNEQS